jgi:histone H3/H4
MVLPAPKKRAFRDVFKQTTGRMYKPRYRQHPLVPQQMVPDQRVPLTPARALPGGTFDSVLIIENALREIKQYQSTLTADKLIIPKTNCNRLVREVMQERQEEMFGNYWQQHAEWHIEADALVVLQTMTEHIIVTLMEMWYLFTEFNSNTTVKSWPFMRKLKVEVEVESESESESAELAKDRCVPVFASASRRAFLI